MAKGKKSKSRKGCCKALVTMKKQAKMCFNKQGKAVIVSRKTSTRGRANKACAEPPRPVGAHGCGCKTKGGGFKFVKKAKCGR